jgi:hypothetical protein
MRFIRYEIYETVVEVLLYYIYAIREHKRLFVGSLLCSPTDWSQAELLQAIKNSAVAQLLSSTLKFVRLQRHSSLPNRPLSHKIRSVLKKNTAVIN